MEGIVPSGHYKSLDHGIHCRRGTYHRISVCMYWCSKGLAMGYSMPLVLVCKVFHPDPDWLPLDSSMCPCNPLPIRNHILRPDQQHHCRKWLVAALFKRKFGGLKKAFQNLRIANSTPFYLWSIPYCCELLNWAPVRWLAVNMGKIYYYSFYHPMLLSQTWYNCRLHRLVYTFPDRARDTRETTIRNIALKRSTIECRMHTGEPKLWPISWANVTCDTAGGTCFP